MKIYFEILFLIILVFIFAYALFYSVNILFAPGAQQGEACFGQNCFFVELAKTNAEREKGLMYRKELNKNSGMLFVFDKEGVYPFWMQNTLISLDIIWINSNNKIVFIAENAQPCKGLICSQIKPGVKAKYVLEINAGLANNFNIKIGDLVQITPSL
ncbi:MAG: hypothetical protein A2358_01760 [Candidatus Staskawiczbacteria bacterium RIFOXYB1_FULL_37_44]|uniref:DUF192 domain-containing protein n=1 Tax=Candidatus Staskawiczbacteria bacterium RIFOXYB1_FULL_37_44 TaxID=1802223 RepID=A0A1G2IV98_9BACT|nr:MAG: hypothetical protein A2358_01760 [Candidatus Staskawiczbacteria bacterium RIFOXYB1_FULL_37_44]OGZ84575.1 MAG: hypothetical protein A2416_01655 [Candidatus Staskawiczbacteria bacterium RIFOXYC1_FULL_37_52]OGZ87474.1 MAG: hypothetical protein A2444_02030 [Candidatus Staskawiczbacteria bacterium RIFOXYC2_FULL_37_19]